MDAIQTTALNWQLILTIVGSILIPIAAAIGWMISHFDKKIDDVRTGLHSDINNIREDIKRLDCRLSRMEGRYEERGYWESRNTGTMVKEY